MHASATSHSSVSISQWLKSASTACLCHIDLRCHMIKELPIFPLKPLNAADCLRRRITRIVWISCPALNETIIHVCLLKAQLKSLFRDSPQSYCLPAQAVSALCSSYVDQHFNQHAENLKSNSCRFQICVSKGILTVCCEYCRCCRQKPLFFSPSQHFKGPVIMQNSLYKRFLLIISSLSMNSPEVRKVLPLRLVG